MEPSINIHEGSTGTLYLIIYGCYLLYSSIRIYNIYMYMGQHMRFWDLYAQKLPHLYSNSDVFRGARGQHFSQSLDLHQYFVYASREGSGEIVHMYRLV